MRSLFWRYFLTFWLAAAIVVCAAVSLTAGIAWQRVNSLDGLSAANLTRDAQLLGLNDDESALRRWVRAVEERYSALRIYIVYADGRDILTRVVPERVENKLRAYRLAREAGTAAPQAYFPVLPESEAGKVSWWDPQTITLATGEPLYMAFLPYDALQWERLESWQLALLLGLAALVLTAPLCWALTRGFTGPMRELKQAARALADGRLATRTPAALARRRDELGQFARDFDAMAARMQDLVAAHEQLLRNVAHELRSPLARLMLGVELARRKDDRLDLQLDRIEREGQRLDVLVGRTLALARLGAMPPPTARVDLAGIVGQVVEDGRFEARARGVRIGWEPPAGDMMLAGDADSLRSAVENVLRNAIRHTDPARPIRVALRADGPCLVVEVADGGPGVPQSELPRIFEPFYRVREGSAGQSGGTGLGLSIVAACVRRHGGTVSARNIAPAGLQVQIRLPRAGQGRPAQAII
ncbi:ATP-binding protein [Orrella sp. JC864]|uniref:HAMP domain-containing sensor histidine kinase n=1 Tax=Orrella sp. JC864 TaxID=3120298 RepID=UPI00300BAA90